jgi:hypothetical protein
MLRQLIVAAITAAFAPAVVAQDCAGGFLPVPGAPGFNDGVADTCSFDADGPGPAPQELIAVGYFVRSGVEAVSCIARWDGMAWRPLGSGLTPNPNPIGLRGGAFALAVYNNQLYVGGDFVAAGGLPLRYIARWNGTNWSDVGSNPFNGPIYALKPHNGVLYAGGNFSAGGSVGNAIAAWNGSSWAPMGVGLNAAVGALSVDNGSLCAGGRFTMSGAAPVRALARWTGSQWIEVGGGIAGNYVPNSVLALELTPWGLMVGGYFRTAGGLPSEHLALWYHDEWRRFNNPEPVADLMMFNNFLYMTSNASNSSGSVTPYFRRWNNVLWETLPAVVGGGVGHLGTFNGQVLVGGTFAAAPPVTCNNIAQWSGESWTTVGQGFATINERFQGDRPTLNGFAAFGADLIAVGAFDTVGGAAASGIAAWDGLAWRPYAGGLFTSSANPRTLGHCAAVYNGDLVVGGDFTRAGTTPAARIARWNGSQWSPYGVGADDDVRHLIVHNGSLIAAGDFLNIGSTPVSHIARFNGTSWSSMGGGTTSSIHAMTIYNGDLYVGGGFTTIGGVTASRIARWNGSSWSPVGAGLDGQVNALAALNGSLYVGGFFANAGGQPASRIARWDGTGWNPVGTGADISVTQLFAYDGALIANGGFNVIGGVTAGGCARFDPGTQQWTPFGGTLATVGPYFNHQGELMVNRRYSRADTARMDTWGRWTGSIRPWVARHPLDGSAIAGASMQLTAALASGYVATSYQWRRNGQDISDGPTPWGASITGAMTATLSLANVTTQDSGSYTCVISHPCGAVTTNAATVTVTPACGSADFNGDGDFGTDQDIEAFFACLAGSCCPTCWQGGADFNGDGDSGTDQDIEALFRVLAGGTC